MDMSGKYACTDTHFYGNRKYGEWKETSFDIRMLLHKPFPQIPLLAISV